MTVGQFEKKHLKYVRTISAQAIDKVQARKAGAAIEDVVYDDRDVLGMILFGAIERANADRGSALAVDLPGTMTCSQLESFISKVY